MYFLILTYDAISLLVRYTDLLITINCEQNS